MIYRFTLYIIPFIHSLCKCERQLGVFLLYSFPFEQRAFKFGLEAQFKRSPFEGTDQIQELKLFAINLATFLRYLFFRLLHFRRARLISPYFRLMSVRHLSNFRSAPTPQRASALRRLRPASRCFVTQRARMARLHCLRAGRASWSQRHVFHRQPGAKWRSRQAWLHVVLSLAAADVLLTHLNSSSHA